MPSENRRIQEKGRDNSGRQQKAAHHCRVGCEKANQQVRDIQCTEIKMT